MNANEDRRVRRTRRVLREVFIEELQHRELRKITVKTLCDRADINRSTFYLHYEDVFDLWESLQQEIIGRLDEILHSFQAESILTSPLPLLLEITAYLESENFFSSKLFMNRESVILLDKIKASFIDFFLENSGRIIRNEDIAELEVYITFVMSGAVSLYHKWFLGEIDISLNRLAYAIEKLITGGVEDFLSDIRIDR